jgi:hypothetical protein
MESLRNAIREDRLEDLAAGIPHAEAGRQAADSDSDC